MGANDNIVSVFISDTRNYSFYGDKKLQNGDVIKQKILIIVKETRNGTLALTPYIDGAIQNTVFTGIFDIGVTSNWDKAAYELAKKIVGKGECKLQTVVEDFIAVSIPFKSAHRYGIRFTTLPNDNNKNVIAQLSDYKNAMYPDSPMVNYGRLQFTMGNRKNMFTFVKKNLSEVLQSEIYNNDPDTESFDRRKLAIQGLADCCRKPIRFNFIKYLA